MKKALTKINKELYFYKDGIKHIVDYKDKTTYPNGLTGYISGLSGNISSGLYGDCTNIIGNLDDCEITAEERGKGIDIKDLVE